MLSRRKSRHLSARADLARRRFLLGATAIGVTMTAFTDHAQAFFPHGVAVFGGGTPNLTVTLRSTDTQLVDLSSVLSGVSTATSSRVTVAVSGSASVRVMPYFNDLYGNGSSKNWHPATLTRNPFSVSLVTSGASTGTGVGTIVLTWSGGSYTIGVNIDNTPPTTWALGQNTLATFGGYPLNQYYASATDWTITSQSTSGRYAINTSTNCVALAGSAGGSPTAGTPSGTDTVTVHSASLGVTTTITFSYVANQWDTAYVGDNSQTFITIHNASSSLHFGDVVRANDTPAGQWENPTYSDTYTYGYRLSPPTQRSGGPAAPSASFAGGSYIYQRSRDPGFITLTGRTPWGWRPNKICIIPDSNGDSFFRWLNVDFRTNQDPPTANGLVVTVASNGQCYWQMADGCVADQLNLGFYTSSDFRYSFAIDNYVGRPGTAYNTIDGFQQENQGITMLASPGQIIGNCIEGIGNDAIAHLLYNPVYGSGQSAIDFNIIRNKQDCDLHGDFCQQYIDGSADRLMAFATTDKRFDCGRQVGNFFVRGKGMIGDGTTYPLGTDAGDGQGSYCGDFPVYSGEYKADIQLAGMVYCGVDLAGVARKWFGCGTTVQQCTLLSSAAYLANQPSGSAPPAILVDGESGVLSITDNAIANGINTGGGAGVDQINIDGAAGPPNPVYTNNYAGWTSAASIYANPSALVGNAQLTREDVWDALQPVAGSAITVAGGASRVIGAIGSSRIDPLNWTWDASVLQPAASAPTSMAYCDTPGAVTGTFTSGGTITGPTLTWHGSVTLLNRTFQDVSNGLSILQNSSSRSMTVPSGLSGHTGIYIERVTDSGGNICVGVSSTFTFS